VAADDLNASLRRGAGMRFATGPSRRGIGIITLLLTGIAGIAAWLIAWPVLHHDPSAGEPVVTVSLKKSPSEATSHSPDGALAMRESLGAEQDEAELASAGNGMVKITIQRGIADGNEVSAEAGPVMRHVPEGVAPQTTGIRLAKAPDPGLIEAGAHGALPRIGKDGRRPSQVYARPTAPPLATGSRRPRRIAILLTGLGISVDSTREAIRRLAGPVSFAFAPYGSDLQTWVDKARSRGHEVALQLPMEPFDYPESDPGPHTMLANASSTQNVEQLRWLLARMTGYFAVTNYMGAKFTASPRALTPVLDEAARRGLAFIDDGSSPRSQVSTIAASHGLPAVTGDMIIDSGQSARSIAAALKDLERLAHERGQAIGIATALPSTIDAITRWADGLSARGIVLVPVSAVMSQPSRS
jgi:uncharacterized protein